MQEASQSAHAMASDVESANKKMEATGEHSEHIAGAARSFGFLGKQVSEMGEGLDSTNSALGETVSGLGGLTGGIGEAIHGYHALHTAIEVATGAQVFLNSISPLGWTAMAVGAIAAGAAYVTLTQHTETAEEAAKKMKETLGTLDAMHGKAFDHAADSKVKELQAKIEEARKFADNQSAEKVGLAAGPVGMAAGYLYEQHAIESAKSALEEFNKAAAKHREQEAASAADSALDHMVEEAEKLNRTPLEQFIEQLRKSGRTAQEQAEELARFKDAAAKINDAEALKKSAEILHALQEELKHVGMDSNQAKLADLAEQAEATGNKLVRQDYERAAAINLQLDAMKEQAKEQEKQQQHFEQLKTKAKELVDALNPAEKLKDAQKELDELVKTGLISQQQSMQQMTKLRQEALKSLMSEDSGKGDKGFVQFGTEAAVRLQAEQRAEDERKQYAERTLAAMEKQRDEQKTTNDWLSKLAGKTGMQKVMDTN
jgi:phage-related minor tail protein